MVVEYLVVSSGTLTQAQLNVYGQDNWLLNQVVQPERSLNIIYIFSKSS